MALLSVTNHLWPPTCDAYLQDNSQHFHYVAEPADKMTVDTAANVKMRSQVTTVICALYFNGDYWVHGCHNDRTFKRHCHNDALLLS